MVSKIHGATISNFALLCFVLSISSAISFYCIWILYKKKKSNIPN
ncbi:bicyclomycin resistance protein (Bcr1) [Rickettsia parkeri str. Portsmouth]|nr:bicyclomycin resistance protein (Bcr1) [Rickettsia parkeri str. Portsmouth]